MNHITYERDFCYKNVSLCYNYFVCYVTIKYFLSNNETYVIICFPLIHHINDNYMMRSQKWRLQWHNWMSHPLYANLLVSRNPLVFWLKKETQTRQSRLSTETHGIWKLKTVKRVLDSTWIEWNRLMKVSVLTTV